MPSENVLQTAQQPPLPLPSPSPLAPHTQPQQQQQQQHHGPQPLPYGQPYVPYQNTAPQQMTQMPQMQYPNNPTGAVTYMTVPYPPPQPTESKSSKLSKYILHALILVMSVIGIGFAFSLLTRGMKSDRYSDYDYLDYYIPSLSAGPIFILAFLWSLAEAVVRCSRHSKAGIHPGAHVGVCLCLWMSAVIVGALLALYISSPYGYNDCDVSSSSSSSSYRNQGCQPTAPALFIGVGVLTLLVAGAELVLFIVACVDTHTRNRWKRNLVIASTPYWAPPPQGFYVASGQQQQLVQHTLAQQPPMTHPPTAAASTPMQQPLTAQTHAQAASSETQHHDAADGSVGGTPAPALPQHGVKEFYTPGGVL
ncbi:hypothetical protein E4U55_000556 [Claviceps digitariae]|nr:hypothetical protein E4U55_000556 [Claviceps digitariae]